MLWMKRDTRHDTSKWVEPNRDTLSIIRSTNSLGRTNYVRTACISWDSRYGGTISTLTGASCASCCFPAESLLWLEASEGGCDWWWGWLDQIEPSPLDESVDRMPNSHTIGRGLPSRFWPPHTFWQYPMTSSSFFSNSRELDLIDEDQIKYIIKIRKARS